MTIKDIAKLAGVSHTTVSRVINNSSRVAPATKQRILDVIQEKGFVPNQAAQTMISGRSYELGLLVQYDISTFPMEFFSTILEGIVSEIQRYGYTLSVLFKGANNRKVINRLDGIFILGINQKETKISKTDMPVIFINQEGPSPDIGHVVADDEGGAYQIVSHLIERGHTHICFLNGRSAVESGQTRKRGYLKALREHRIEFDPEYEIFGDFEYYKAYEQTKTKLAQRPEITAIFSSTDLMALGAIKAIGELGLKIPSDIAVAGFDNQVFSEYTYPSLTTVSKPRRLMGAVAGKRMIDILNGKEISGGVILPTELIIRDST
ncbi:LacI family DNA-binding transcriptional regulator [Neglectibacter caecimuris]|uniref:LacI family DNA-binding transcriptional regulator n=1 Tax=Neglectibacter caecimuris TaxID=3093658 RepID=UPI002AC90748|nr:LacI family DNA-binding transcriptional regulator [Neglectibacter sp. M00184]